MANKIPRVVLDTNILISSYVFGGKPEEIVKLIIQARIEAVTSPILISEFVEILRKKFQVDSHELQQFEEEIKELFEIVYPSQHIHVVRDEEDNRVLETALEGKADYIISGDKDLLDLKEFQTVRILSPNEFLELLAE